MISLESRPSRGEECSEDDDDELGWPDWCA